jgi:NAD(P)-dependent dehydrogenase (short-subunit alcohol dehydrogenase family)
MKFAIPHMVAGGGGSIVMSSSVAGVTGNPGTVAYTATKHAIIGIMRVAAVEYAAAGIRVNTVNPGPIDTPMMRELESGFAPEDPSQGAEALQGGTLLKRYGTPDEVAGLMLYLASDESRYCTGGVYMIDGGMQHA